jgi:hypothetical protein
MDDNPTPLDALIESAREYGKTNIELIKFKVVDKSADLLSSLVTSLVILIVASIAFFIVNLGLSLWLGTLLGANFYGFFVVGGFYALVAVPLFIFREKWLKYLISNALINYMLNKKEVDEK